MAISNKQLTQYADEVYAYSQDLIKHLEANYNSRYPNSDRVRFETVVGRKYIKINQTDGGVHCFIDKNTGDVFKAASWRKPAPHVRYNLLERESREMCFNRADWAGGYLYLR